MTALTTRWIRWLDEPGLSAADDLPARIGGKAAGLVQLQDAGFRVPKGFVIETEACRQYLESGRLSKELSQDVLAAVERLEQETGRRFGCGESPLILAVRSGAPFSMPGLLVTRLNVGHGMKSSTSKQRWRLLDHAIRDIFNSWISPEAEAYRTARGLDHNAGTAVLIQEQISTEAAGVVFSRNPQHPQAEEMVLEAVAGSGEAVVSDRTTAHRWIIERETLAVQRFEPATPDQDPLPLECLPLAEIASTALRVEQFFGTPIDLEWGWTGETLYLFQARPIPSPTEMPAKPPCDPADIWRDERLAAEDTLWVRHNLGESAPHPTPLTWSFLKKLVSVDGAYGEMYRRLGFTPAGQGDETPLTLIGGQIYASPRKLLRFYGVDFPLVFDRDELQRDPSAIDRFPQVLDVEHVSRWFLLRLPWIMWVLRRASRRVRRDAPRVIEDFESRAVPQLTAFVQSHRAVDRARLSDRELVQHYSQLREELSTKLYADLTYPGMIGATVWTMFLNQMGRETDPSRTDPAIQRLMVAAANAVASEWDDGSNALSGGDRWQDRFGHRAFEELELAAPRWRENPAAVRELTARLDRESAISVEDAITDAWQRFLEETSDPKPEVLEHLKLALTAFLALLGYRERGKDQFLRGFECLRETVVEIDRRLGGRGDVFYWTHEELERWPAETPDPQRIVERRLERQRWKTQSLPPVIDLEAGPETPEQPEFVAGDEIPVTAISPGEGTGRLWHLSHGLPPENERVVLVTERLMPKLLPYFDRTSAIIVEQANLLSHGAVLARSFQIPVVVHAAAARLPHGNWAKVDATAGRLSLGTTPRSPENPRDSGN